jgi:hypothetical protein
MGVLVNHCSGSFGMFRTGPSACSEQVLRYTQDKPFGRLRPLIPTVECIKDEKIKGTVMKLCVSIFA